MRDIPVKIVNEGVDFTNPHQFCPGSISIDRFINMQRPMKTSTFVCRAQEPLISEIHDHRTTHAIGRKVGDKIVLQKTKSQSLS